MNKQLEKKLKDLPSSPGVYRYKDKSGEIIYIGKAAILKNRVRQYFQKSRPFDPKTTALVQDIEDVDWTVVESEIDALFLEAELVRRYLPKYNILLRDDKSSSYIRISYKSDHPTVTTTRRPLDDGAEYFGPFFNAGQIKSALKHLRKAFPYSTHKDMGLSRACLLYQIGLCPGIEANKTSLEDYRKNLQKLMQYIRGNHTKLVVDIEKDMKTAAKNQDYEQASKLRNQLFALKALRKSIVFSDKEFLDVSKDMGLAGLAKMLRLDSAPSRIEGYDISHMSGTDTVASMVVFVNGLPEKTSYRKFKSRLAGNDDFAHMHEAITRRLKHRHLQSWGRPDLILIDGGKGQLSAAISARDKAGQTMPMIGLAKREERIIIHKEASVPGQKIDQYFVNERAVVDSSDEFLSILLPNNAHETKLLQRVRDESHRFAVSYHSTLKRSRQTSSVLDSIPGVGPATKKKLIKTFGSTKAVTQTSLADLSKTVGPKLARKVYDQVHIKEAKK